MLVWNIDKITLTEKEVESAVNMSELEPRMRSQNITQEDLLKSSKDFRIKMDAGLKHLSRLYRESGYHRILPEPYSDVMLISKGKARLVQVLRPWYVELDSEADPFQYELEFNTSWHDILTCDDIMMTVPNLGRDIERRERKYNTRRFKATYRKGIKGTVTSVDGCMVFLEGYPVYTDLEHNEIEKPTEDC